MKNLLSAAVAVVALSTVLANTSIAEPATGEIGVEVKLAELQQRIEELEARVGGKTLNSNLQAQNRAFRHLRVPAKGSSPD